MTDPQHPDVLPMWPRDAPEDYVAARLEVARAERSLRDAVAEVADARRRLPPGRDVTGHTLVDVTTPATGGGADRLVQLVEVFDGRDTLVVYHLMFASDADEGCAMCSMWVDGFHGVLPHLLRHSAFAVVGKGRPQALRDWAARRGWTGLRLLSSHGTDFNRDLNAELDTGAQRPMISVLSRHDDRVRHVYSLPANHLDGSERGIDLLSPVWNVLDLLPTGRGDWYPDNSYVDRTRPPTPQDPR